MQISGKDSESSLRKELLQALMIAPTALNVFIAIASVIGAIEFFGPIVLYILDGWRDATRGIWEWLFKTFGLGDLYFDFIKDAMTYAFFLLLFSLGSFKALWDVICSKHDDIVRKVKWELFPLAFFISSTVVGLLLTDTIRMEFNPDFVFRQLIFVAILFYLIFGLFNFVPLAISYLITLSYKKIIGRSTNGFKIYFNVLLYSFAVFMVWAAAEHSNDSKIFAGSFAFFSFVVVFAVPMMVPIMQPKRMIRLAVYVGVLCFIGFASFSLEYIRQKAITGEPEWTFTKNNSYVLEIKNKLRESCDNSDLTSSMNFYINIAKALNIKPKRKVDFEEYCKCFSTEVVENEPLSTTYAMIDNFDKAIETFLSKQNIETYQKKCL